MEPAGVQENEKELLIDYYIQKVSSRLRQLSSPSEHDKKRWVWELLQNAKDSIAQSERQHVDVEVEVREDVVIFRHNGNPFTPKAMTSLMWQKSGDKRGKVGSSGRFGTGFLTTHTLSKTVDVKSNLKDTNGQIFAFSMTLYRDGETDEQLESGIQRTLSSRVYSNEYTNPWTEFSYRLKNDMNRSCAEAGIANLEQNIFYNLAFTSEFKSIKLIREGASSLIKRGELTKISPKISLHRFEDEIGNCLRCVATVSLGARSFMLSQKFEKDRTLRLSAAIEVDFDNTTILGIGKETPSLFCVFPLVGSEDFNFPIVLNSIDFEPTSERERLLFDGDNYGEDLRITNSGINKTMLGYGLNLYSILLKYFSANKWTNIHYLAIGASGLPKQENDFDKIWYKSEIQAKIRKLLLSVFIVETSQGPKKIREEDDRIYFPKSQSLPLQDIMWDKAFSIMPASLPMKALSREWALLAWEDDCAMLTLEALVMAVSGYGRIQLLPEVIIDKVGWIDELIALVHKNQPELLEIYPIIPTEDGVFKVVTFEGLSYDDGLPTEAIEILSLFNKDWKAKLIKKGITAAPVQLKENELSFVTALNTAIKTMVSDDNPLLFNAILALLSYQPVFDVGQAEEFTAKRKYIYDTAVSLFGDQIVDFKSILKPNAQIWEQADIYISKKFVECIELQNTIKEAELGEEETIIDNVKIDGTESFVHTSMERFCALLSLNLKADKSEQFVLNWLNEFHKFMNSQGFQIGGTVPNQNGHFETLEVLMVDDEIPNMLKDILVFLSPKNDYRNELIGLGIDLQSTHVKTVADIALSIDTAVKTVDRDNIDENFREGVRLLVIDWFNDGRYPDHLRLGSTSFQVRESTHDYLNRRFFEYSFSKKESLEINILWTVEERKDFQKLRKVLPDKVRKRLLEEPELLENHEKLQQENKVLVGQLEQNKVIFDKYPDLTLEKIDRLMSLKELSEGWDTELDYHPDDLQRRVNFENGWKGEAFTYRELNDSGFNVTWPNKSSLATDNIIIDHKGESHYISDQGHKYDLIINNGDNSRSYIQVKTTTTDISQADQIALPISTREWEFIGETQPGEQFYLARVFNINGFPELYFMRLNNISEMMD